MRNIRVQLLAFGTSLACCLHALPAAERAEMATRSWPTWRGPLQNGFAPEARPPIRWSETENVKWKVAVPGKGSATPIVWGQQVFVLTAIPTDRPAPPELRPGAAPKATRPDGVALSNDVPGVYYQFSVLCYDLNTGEEVWRVVAAEEPPHEGGHPTNTFASGSPVTDGKWIYSSFGSFGVYCHDLQGNLRWRRDLGQMQTRYSFGEGTSPALYGDTLVHIWDHEAQSSIVALDAATGETKWQVDRDEPTTWATPFIIEHDGVVQVIASGTNRVRSYDLQSGKLLWECGGQVTNPIPSPLIYKDLAITMTGYRGYAVYATPLSARGDITDSDAIAWRRTDAGPYIASPVLAGDTLYFTKSRDAILYSVNAATGEQIVGEKRVQGLGTMYASPIVADGRLYLCDRSGKTAVLTESPDLQSLAVNEIPEVIDASPVAVGRKLLLRGDQHLYCFEEPASAAN